LKKIWSDITSRDESIKQTANLLSTDPYIDHIVTNPSEAFKSKVNEMRSGSTVLGYTVEFKKDTSGKKSCEFIVPTGSTFKEISKRMLSEPNFKKTNETYLYKMTKLRKLIAAIDAERSLCTGTNSFFPIPKVVSGFSNLSKGWGRGGRKTRKHRRRVKSKQRAKPKTVRAKRRTKRRRSNK
jgi:hypothetical protein